MKRLLLTLLVSASFTSWSQCESNIIASDTMVCPGDNVTLEAFGPSPVLTTTFAGGNNHRGNMFDIVALNSVTIESFDSHPLGDTDYEVYYKVGTHVGSETTASAWTLLGAAINVIAQPVGTGTPIPINVGITIPAGQTYSFYVTSSDVAVSQSYSSGTTAGAVFASDANIEFLEGAGLEYPFGGGTAIFSPRVWNGNINYSTATVVPTTFAGGNNHRGNMFDIVALNSVTIESFDSHPVGDTDYEVYYKVGTHVGSETNAAAWTLLGAATNVIAQPSGNATTIPINVGITIPAGQTYSFYVTSTDVSVSQSYTDGTTAGAVFASDANIEFLEGSAMEYPFGGGGAVFSPRVWNGNINYSIETTYLWDNGATTAQVVNTVMAETTYYVDITYTGCSTMTDSVTISIDPNCPVGLIEGMTKHMKVYPNPTENVLHIELDQMTSELVLHVYSGVGTLVLTEKMTSQSQTLDLSSLARGSYILELSADNYKEIIKVIKN